MIFYLLITLFFLGDSRADEIIRDKDGNYYLLKDDGSFKKLPPLKKGQKYVIKKKVKKKKKSIFRKVEKNSRFKSNQGIR